MIPTALQNPPQSVVEDEKDKDKRRKRRRKYTSYASQDKVRIESFLVLDSVLNLDLEEELQEARQAI